MSRDDFKLDLFIDQNMNKVRLSHCFIWFYRKRFFIDKSSCIQFEFVLDCWIFSCGDFLCVFQWNFEFNQFLFLCSFVRKDLRHFFKHFPNRNWFSITKLKLHIFSSLKKTLHFSISPIFHFKVSISVFKSRGKLFRLKVFIASASYH